MSELLNILPANKKQHTQITKLFMDQTLMKNLVKFKKRNIYINKMQQRRYLSISNNYYYLEFSGLFEVENIIETVCSVLNVITHFHSVRDAALGKNVSRFLGFRVCVLC